MKIYRFKYWFNTLESDTIEVKETSKSYVPLVKVSMCNRYITKDSIGKIDSIGFVYLTENDVNKAIDILSAIYIARLNEAQKAIDNLNSYRKEV